MIRCFTGLPGAGKSYGATVDGIEELRDGNRIVYHNMILDHGEIAAYLREKGYEPDLSLRLIKMPEERSRDFWTYADETGNKNGRLFIIDEAHVYFDSRAWAEIGKAMSVYLTQHRHLNDEVLFVTQHPEMLDKRIRLLIAETTQFRNLRTERWLRWFRPPSWMLWSQFYGLPVRGQKPQAFGQRRLDPAIARCYQTSVGHGGLGRSGKPEEDRKANRLNWKWLLVPVAALIYLVQAGPEMLLRWGIGGSVKALQGEKPTVQIQQQPVPVVKVDPGQPTKHDSAGGSVPTKEAPPPLRVRGYVTDGKHLRIALSDGRVITERDKPQVKYGRIYFGDGEYAIFRRY